MRVTRFLQRGRLDSILVTLTLASVVAVCACGQPAGTSSPPGSAPRATALASVTAGGTTLPSPAPGAVGAQGDYHGAAALDQPAGHAAAAYLQARASAAVTPEALGALPSFFVPRSPDIARETYLARGKRAQWVGNGWPPRATVDTLAPSGVSLTVRGRDASFAGYATDLTSFASGRSDQEGEGLDHVIELKWLEGRWLVHRDEYVSDLAPRQLQKGGAPPQMVQAATVEAAWALGQAGPREIAAANRVVRSFVRLVDQGRYAAAQRLVRDGSHVSAQQLGREVATLKVLETDFTAVPGNARIEVEAKLRADPRPGSGWPLGAGRTYFVVTRDWIGRPWLIDDYGSAP